MTDIEDFIATMEYEECLGWECDAVKALQAELDKYKRASAKLAAELAWYKMSGCVEDVECREYQMKINELIEWALKGDTE